VQAAAAAAIAGSHQLIGSALFCAALNHKQMSLYVAPAFFAHLLGWCLQQPGWAQKVCVAPHPANRSSSRAYPRFEVMCIRKLRKLRKVCCVVSQSSSIHFTGGDVCQAGCGGRGQLRGALGAVPHLCVSSAGGAAGAGTHLFFLEETSMVIASAQ